MGSDAVSKNASIKTLYDRWFDLEKERQTLMATQGRTKLNQDVRGVDSLINRTKRDLQQASNVYLTTLNTRLRTFDQQLTQLRDQLGQYPGLSATEQNLERRVRSLQKLYDDLQ